MEVVDVLLMDSTLTELVLILEALGAMRLQLLLLQLKLKMLLMLLLLLMLQLLVLLDHTVAGSIVFTPFEAGVEPSLAARLTSIVLSLTLLADFVALTSVVRSALDFRM